MKILFKRWGRWIGRGLALLGTSWILFLLIDQWPELEPRLTHLGPESLAALLVSLLLGTCSLLCSGMVFSVILSVHSGKKCSVVELAPSFFTGQLIRYLPGRFWGMVYQIGRWQDQFTPKMIVAANLDLMQLHLIGNLLISIALWFGANGLWVEASLLSVCTVLTIIFLLKLRWFDHFYLMAMAWAGRDDSKRSKPIHWSARQMLSGLGWFGISWLLYVPTWLCLAHATPDVAWTDGLRLCAIYTLAWAAGFLAVITPGGLGVREVIFILLSAPHEGTAVASFLAVVMRFWFIAVDSACLLVSLLLQRYFSKKIRKG